MTDFDKLRQAHELCSATESYYFDISLGVNDGFISLFDANNTQDQFICNPESIDDLITKLRELISPTPKYNVGDTVWYLINVNQINSSTVKKITAMSGVNRYLVEEYFMLEEQFVFPTETALIEAQIEYWRSLREIPHQFRRGVCVHCGDKPFEKTSHGNRPDQSEYCEHESDGENHWVQDKDKKSAMQYVGFKCIKCGEFYR